MAGKGKAPDTKHATLNRLLNDEYLLVHLDPSIKGLIIPPHLMSSPTVTLKLSRSFRGSIELSEKEIVSDLLFGEAYFTCTLPLETIWGVTNYKGQNILWPQTPPQQILAELLEATSKKAQTKPSKPAPSVGQKLKRKSAAHLKRVK